MGERGTRSASCGSFPEEPKGDLFPAIFTQFAPVKDNPVFTAQPKGAWDEKIRERGWILKEGNLYKMWYTGYKADERNKMMKLGYATSTDGIHWKRHPKNPIYEQHWVEDMIVVPYKGTYFMFAEGRNDQAHLLSSKDGIQWKRLGALDVRMTNGKPISKGPYGTPTAWHEKGTWYLMYERRDLGIWLAKSTDMKVWTNVQDEPILRPGPDAYDKDQIAVNQIVKHQGRYYVWYHGSANSGPNKGLWCTCLAVSNDLIHWKKYPGNPLLPLKENKSSGILVHDGKQFRLYTMHNQVHLHLPKKK